MYTDRATPSGGQQPAADLNLLVAPAYAWVYAQTKDVRFRNWHDSLFIGGVKKGTSYLAYAKQFNQAYRWSADGIRWRNS